MKSIVILFNLLILIIFELFYGETVTVKQEVPSSIEVNVGDTVTVTITKGELSGFAKLQQDIPRGIKVDIINSKDGTFSFKDNTLKIIWIALPAEETFVIKYLITAVAPEKTSYILDGKFSYIDQNERQNVDFTSSEIKIGESNILVSNNNEIKENTKSDVDPKLVSQNDDFNIYRRIIETDDPGVLKVEITIEKEELNSFAKIEEFIPLGYSASEDNSNEGFFSYKNNVVKILWMALPFGNKMTASYLIERNEKVDDVNKINGKFSYLKNEATFEADLIGTTIPSIKLSEGDSDLLVDKDDYTKKKDEVVNEQTSLNKAEEVQVQEVVDNNTTPEQPTAIANKINESTIDESDLVNAISNTPSPEVGISYKVQIAAGKKEVSENYFSVNHNLNEKVSIEFHEGWRKYTIGQFPIYKEARDKRNIIWKADNKISDAFVTAYNQGNRITVQEALMISKQQWFK